MLLELLKLKAEKHPVACTAVLHLLLQPGRAFQPPDLQTWLHAHFSVIVRNKRENKKYRKVNFALNKSLMLAISVQSLLRTCTAMFFTCST